jgi:hypothetical protein
MISLIGKLPATLEDRAIIIPMRRRLRSEPISRFRPTKIRAELEPLRRQMMRWSVDRLEALRDADPAVPEQLHDRAADNWRPLCAIADLVGGEWPERARDAALALSTDAEDHGGDGASARLDLLADIRGIFAALDPGVRYVWTELLLRLLGEIPESRWKDLTPYGLAGLLKPYGIKSRDRRQAEKVLKRYRCADFADSFARYLPQPLQNPQQPLHGDNHHEFNDLQPGSHPLHAKPVADQDSDLSTYFDRDVADVADNRAQTGGPREAKSEAAPLTLTVIPTDPTTAPRSPFRAPVPRPPLRVTYRPDLLVEPPPLNERRVVRTPVP